MTLQVLKVNRSEFMMWLGHFLPLRWLVMLTSGYFSVSLMFVLSILNACKM